MDGEELGDDELARLELEVDSELDAMMAQPEHVVPPPVLSPQPPVTPSLPPAPPVNTEPEVTGNLAKGLDDGILPGDLYDAKVEEMITARFEKLDDHQFKKLLQAAPVHPDYDTYCRGIKVELGLDDDWCFGRDEPMLDMVGLHCWAFSRQQLRDRLALGELTAGKEGGNDGRGVGPVGGGGGSSKPPPLVHPSHLETPPQPPPKAAAPTAVEKAASPAVEKAASAAIANAAHPAVEQAASPAVEKAASAAIANAAHPAVEQAASPAVEKAASAAIAKAAHPAVGEVPSPAVEKAAPAAIANAAHPAVGEVPSPAVEKAKSPAVEVPSPSVEKAAAETAAAPEPVTPAKAAGTLGGGLTVKAPAMPPPSTLSARVDEVAAQVAEENGNGPNSVTHRPEYMAYLRAARNPSKMCKSLIPMFRGDQKLDLFRIWLEKGRDFSRCEVEVKRRNLQSTSAKSKDVAMSVAQLEATGRYSKEDIQELVKRKKEQGAYIQDPNFPGREDLYQYVINQETSAEMAHTREDSQEVSSAAVLEGQEALALTEDGCDFAANTAPTIRSLMNDLGGVAGEAPAAGPTPKAKATARKGKGKGKGQSKGKEGDTDKAPEPDKLPTPLAKATTLKGKVLPVFNLSSDQNPGGLISTRGRVHQTLADHQKKFLRIKGIYHCFDKCSIYSCEFSFFGHKGNRH